MQLLRGVLDRFVLLAGVLVAACIPSFIVQYHQRLGGRLDQVQADPAQFQAIADHDFSGHLSRLIHYHLASRDPTFHQEGIAIQAMADAAAHLRGALQGLDTGLVHQCLYLLRHPDFDLLHSTWGAYQPGFTLTLQSAAFALVLGLLLWLLFLGPWHGTAAIVRLGRRPGPKRQGSAPIQNG